MCFFATSNMVHVRPRFRDRKTGDASFGKPQAPEKAEMTSSSLLSRLIAVEVSPSLNVSVFLRLRSVLLTMVSTMKRCEFADHQCLLIHGPLQPIDKLLRDVGQRPSLQRLGLADEAAIDQLVTDTLDDTAIRNSPRLPTYAEARSILESVAG